MFRCLLGRSCRLEAPRRRMSNLQRLLYLSIGIVLAGFLYFHTSLIVVPKSYYAIDRVLLIAASASSSSSSSREADASPPKLQVFTDGLPMRKENLLVVFTKLGKPARFTVKPDSHEPHSVDPLHPQPPLQRALKGSSNYKLPLTKNPEGEVKLNQMTLGPDAEVATNENKTMSRSVPFIKEWELNLVRGCEGRFTAFSGRLIELRDVTVNRSLAKANARGGEDINSVRNQPEESETYSYKLGFFSIPCRDTLKMRKAFRPERGPDNVTSWFDVLQFDNATGETKEKAKVAASRDERFGLTVCRYEYANLYWMLMELYDAFLTITHLGQTPQNTHIVLMDAKPWSHLDVLWTAFFGRVSQLAQLPKAVTFTRLAWNFQRKYSPMLTHSPLSLHAEFRTRILTSFGVSEPAAASTATGRFGTKCSITRGQHRLSILLVWRRNYVAHPRNMAGLVARKIANEDQLLNATAHAFPRCDVRGVQLDRLRMREQVKLISDTDVLVGMHGAAFAFTLLLPVGSGAVEMFPANVATNWHMRHLAESRGVHYAQWKNKYLKNEMWHSKSTIINTSDVSQVIRDITERICSWKVSAPKTRAKSQAEAFGGNVRTIGNNH